MSITVDTINLRFNVTPDYKQQLLQQLQEDLKQSQKNYAAAEKQCEKYSLKVSSLESKLSNLKARRDELSMTAFALYLDKPWFAGFFGITSLITIISIFINAGKDTGDKPISRT